MDIKILYNGIWQFANPDQRTAFLNYKNRPIYTPEGPITTGGLTVYRTNNDPYLPTYISDGTTSTPIPIANFSDVKVFLQDLQPVDWYDARNYQIWAFYDFVYDNKVKKTYASKYSSYLAYPPNTRDVTTIDIDDLPPNIIFSISRNDNNSVYYERNDPRATRVRICDNNTARIGFRGFYTRMTMDVGMIVIPPPQQFQQNTTLIMPNDLEIVKTSIEEEQCIMCYDNKKNLLFLPCRHNIACSSCYTQFQKKDECPVCKQKITSLEKK
jgi:hypothetical protein